MFLLALLIIVLTLPVWFGLLICSAIVVAVGYAFAGLILLCAKLVGHGADAAGTAGGL